MNMNFKIFLAILASKITRVVMRVLGKGATAYPGKIANKICPSILKYLSKNVKTVIITGTNGKTTTSRMIEQAFLDEGLSFFSNKSGANLMNGIITEFAINSSLCGKNKKEYAIIECDEAAFKSVAPLVDPQYIVVTNVFKDQLDRFGEVLNTLENIREGVKNSPNAILCLNTDCSMTASLKEGINNKTVLFGVDIPLYENKVKENSDAAYCLHCNSKYNYDYVTFGHLGKYSCPGCGYSTRILYSYI